MPVCEIGPLLVHETHYLRRRGGTGSVTSRPRATDVLACVSIAASHQAIQIADCWTSDRSLVQQCCSRADLTQCRRESAETKGISLLTCMASKPLDCFTLIIQSLSTSNCQAPVKPLYGGGNPNGGDLTDGGSMCHNKGGDPVVLSLTAQLSICHIVSHSTSAAAFMRALIIICCESLFTSTLVDVHETAAQNVSWSRQTRLSEALVNRRSAIRYGIPKHTRARNSPGWKDLHSFLRLDTFTEPDHFEFSSPPFRGASRLGKTNCGCGNSELTTIPCLNLDNNNTESPHPSCSATRVTPAHSAGAVQSTRPLNSSDSGSHPVSQGLWDPLVMF